MAMTPTQPLFLILMTAGLTVGFGHCLGMCGPIVVSLSLSLKGRPFLLPHLLYHGGRITTYALLGGLMGWTGSLAQWTAGIGGLQRAATILAGAVIVFMGLAMTGWIPLGVFGDDYEPKGWISRGLRKLTSFRNPLAYYAVGLLLGLLPCGPVYTALVAAAGAGTDAPNALGGMIQGMGMMAAFGLGTLPALLLVGKFADFTWLKWRTHLYRLGAVLMIAVGCYYVIRGIRY
jgi:sulfite exporter TauE/SafE